MKTQIAIFNRFEFELPAQAVADCGKVGPCDVNVTWWALIVSRPANITAELLRAELADYGAWDDSELADDAANWLRIVWLAAGNIREENHLTNRQH